MQKGKGHAFSFFLFKSLRNILNISKIIIFFLKKKTQPRKTSSLVLRKDPENKIKKKKILLITLVGLAWLSSELEI
jgi:hypothetical protein